MGSSALVGYIAADYVETWGTSGQCYVGAESLLKNYEKECYLVVQITETQELTL